MLSQVLFGLILFAGIGFFSTNIGKITRNIRLGRGRDKPLPGTAAQRWATMGRVALGQSKMVTRPIAGALHVMVYVGFIVVNIEVLEIIIDGVTGQHRIIGNLPGIAALYNSLTFAAEVFMLLVLIGTFGFLLRRDVGKLPRFEGPEMQRWPKLDARIILWTEVVLILALFTMNITDLTLQARDYPGYHQVGFFPISGPISNLLLESGVWDGVCNCQIFSAERTAWWVHIIGILLFLNYIPYSKHFHIFLAFPNTWYTPQKPKGQFANNETVTQEVQGMLGGDPFAAPAEAEVPEGEPERFGARDVMDLHWKNLMDSYTCTECGRCTSQCPANQTGKLLSPRKIMMDTRDRLTEVGYNIEANGGEFQDDGKALLGDYISTEELWACTTCNACVEACPVNINPLDIIVQMRQYLVMEESNAGEQLNSMFNNVENNGAPWAFPSADRFKWAEGITLDTDKN